MNDLIENSFPKWNPNNRLFLFLEDGVDRQLAFKRFRNSSSNFIKKQTVRYLILEKYNYKCAKCSSKIRLQLDHIESVYSCFKTKKYNFCNSYDNLQILCLKCNTSKKP